MAGKLIYISEEEAAQFRRWASSDAELSPTAQREALRSLTARYESGITEAEAEATADGPSVLAWSADERGYQDGLQAAHEGRRKLRAAFDPDGEERGSESDTGPRPFPFGLCRGGRPSCSLAGGSRC
jgi:hypothetical protein